MARRSRGVPPPKPFDQAFVGIDKLEIAVVGKTTDVNFSPEQVVRWMFPDEIVDKLQAAFVYTRDIDRGSHITEKLTLPVVFPAVSCHFTIKAKSKEVHMLVPESGRVHVDDTRGAYILDSLRQAYAQHTQFEKVRKVVRWLNAKATIGAARHYCPWLTSVLPPEHLFHSAGGTIFREPGNTAEIMDTMRECGAIMAGALLCGDLDNLPAKNLVQVQFSGQRDDASYISQAFGLL